VIREKIILDLAHNKEILDIGSIGQTGEYSLWNIYKDINYKSLIGIDLHDAEAQNVEIFQLKNEDINTDQKIVYGNMENYEFNKLFDLIVAGDVLEHVSNQGLFLDNIRKHLNDNGQLIITTPNAKWPTVIFKPNPTHTLWHDRYTLAFILEKHGFKIDSFRYYFGNKKNYNWIARILTLRQSMVVVCSKK
jgi:2-polyprenyl-3-methyl-5-hydroxy-6-metoxy-1,4-benzoquinol methylase